MKGAARVYADYLFERNHPLAVYVASSPGVEGWTNAGWIHGAELLIQLVEVIHYLARGAFLLVPGLLVFAVVFLLGAWRLFGQAIWHINAWRD